MHPRYAIIDCYVDEPACFGVPPFVSPYPRYIFGALVDAGVPPEAIDYHAIDALRAADLLLEEDYRWCFVVGGAVVPGKYLGSRIGSMAEIRRIITSNPRGRFAVGGPAGRVIQGHDSTVPVLRDIEAFAHAVATGAPADRRRTVTQIARWAAAGAPVVTRHPDYPHLICEIETYRGCPRSTHCSFCSEGIIGTVEFRAVPEILAEIDSLGAQGITRFRLGRQADILQYGTRFAGIREGFPRPEPSAVRELFTPLRERRERGAITVLNIDNANPGTMANFPGESAEILEIIAGTVTPGDTMAMGVESFDDRVVRMNGLKLPGERVMVVVRLINEIGGGRVGGIPILLPGINLLHGLAGESPETFAVNYRRLCEIRDAGLMVRRINIRKVQPFPGTPLHASRPVISRQTERRFEYYRDRIRDEIDTVMLERVFPVGTVLRQSRIQEERAGYSYGKQIASYSITAKFPMPLPRGSYQDALVVGHRERSLMAIPLPSSINSLPPKALEMIPGIGKKRAGSIVLRRPFRDRGDAKGLLDAVPPLLLDRLLP
ncbi:MAG: radical SAM protein [Spirochaetes bacterium]|nr:radical SAM protein [Spirochaetota bacterium]